MDTSKNNERIIEKFNEIQSEILRIGWKGILQTYHPDSNYEHPEAFKVFQLYKEIYENMKKRLTIDGDISSSEISNSETSQSNGPAN